MMAMMMMTLAVQAGLGIDSANTEIVKAGRASKVPGSTALRLWPPAMDYMSTRSHLDVF